MAVYSSKSIGKLYFFSEDKMFIMYKGQKYKCSFIDKFILIWIKIKLSIKRGIRLFKIMLPKRDLLLYMLIVLLWLLWGLIANIIDSQFKQKYEAYVVTLWGLKDSIFSSVVLAFAIGAFNHLNRYRKTIKRQYYLYVDTMNLFEEIVKSGYSSSVWSKFNFMYNRHCFEEGIKHLRNRNTVIDNVFCIYIDAINERIEKLEQEIRMGNLIIKDENRMNEYLYKVKIQIPKVMTEENSVEFKILLDLLFEIINQLRYVWRRDENDDFKIISILSKYETNKINDDFYKRMILSDFDIHLLELHKNS